MTINPKTDKEQQEIQNELQIIKENSEKQPLPQQLEDHDYSNYEDPSFTLDQQYADDIGWASTSQHVLDNIEKNTTAKLKQ